MTGGPDTLPPTGGEHDHYEGEMQVFGRIVRQVVREETAPVRNALAHLSDQMARDRADNEAHRAATDTRLDRHEQRFVSLERGRLWLPALVAAVVAFVALGIAISNTILLRSIIQMAQSHG